MSQTFSPEEIRKIARLARLKLTEAEESKYATQFSSILGFFEQLQEVDTNNVNETSQVTGLSNITQKDIVDFESLDRMDKTLQCSPHPLVDRSICLPKMMA